MNRILRIAENVLLPAQDINEIAEYLSYNEWGIAFEILCTSITDNKIIIRKAQYDEIESIGAEMEMDNSLWRDIHLG